MPDRLVEVLTAVLALACAAVLAAAWPVSARADEPGDTTTTTITTPAPPAVTDTDPSVPVSPPVVVSAPGLGVQVLLIKRVRSQIVLARKEAWRWQRLLGQSASPGGNIWNLGSPQAAKVQLQTWQNRSKRLRPAVRQRILQLRSAVESMLQVMGQTLPARTLAYKGSLVRLYLQMNARFRETRLLYAHPPHLAQFMCIHHYEGSWTDGGGPYYGGLQMDLSFQSSYAPLLLRTKGTANYWTPLEQIWTAEKAAKTRGFWPWPNTARDCGLL